jgi:hypothetical protein
MSVVWRDGKERGEVISAIVGWVRLGRLREGVDDFVYYTVHVFSENKEC